MLKSTLRTLRRRARKPQPKRPARIHSPPSLADLLARLDGQRIIQSGLPDFTAEAKRLEEMLAAAGLAIVPMPVNLADRQPRLTPAQIGTAMDLLKWSNERLAEACGMSAEAVRTAVTGARRTRDRTLTKIREALEAEGIVFSFGADGSSGVVVDPQAKPTSAPLSPIEAT